MQCVHAQTQIPTHRKNPQTLLARPLGVGRVFWDRIALISLVYVFLGNINNYKHQ